MSLNFIFLESRSQRDFNDAQLRDAIEVIQKDSPCAGYCSVQRYLFRRNVSWLNSKKIRRVMVIKFSLSAHIRRKFITTTDSKHGLPVFPNLIRGKVITGINQLWVSDITYIRIATGFVYLAVILDVFLTRFFRAGMLTRNSLQKSISSLCNFIGLKWYNNIIRLAAPQLTSEYFTAFPSSSRK